MDIFESRNISPMLIKNKNTNPFDDPDYIFELKLDGFRCLAYIDERRVELVNKRGLVMTEKFPELTGIVHQVKHKCILDCEVIVMVQGKPSFDHLRPRTVMTNRFKIDMAAQRYPATMTAFDILYANGEQITERPLIERKEILRATVEKENERFSVSRFIFEKGKALYNTAQQQALEGVVAKKTKSRYLIGKYTEDWLKIKYLLDDDFVVLGFIYKENYRVSLLLAQFDGNKAVYKGHVTLGVSGADFRKIETYERASALPCPLPEGNEGAILIKPDLVCTVSYLEQTSSGSLRQPVFKGLRNDKDPLECKV